MLARYCDPATVFVVIKGLVVRVVIALHNKVLHRGEGYKYYSWLHSVLMCKFEMFIYLPEIKGKINFL